MLGSLLKKQFLELNQLYFTDRKTGKRRNTAGIIGYLTLFVVLMLVLMFVFFQLTFGLKALLMIPDLQWVYFALMGILSILLGTFGSVFNTYQSLYKAKDNDLLLSMPIPPGKIVFVRVFGVILMSLLYSALPWIPAVITYWITVPLNVSAIVIPVLLTFVISIFVSVLTCLLGFVVAEVSSHLKNKTFVTVLISLVLFAAYYYVCLRANILLEAILTNTEQIGRSIRGGLWPLYQLGMAATGSWLSFAIFTLLTLALFAVCCFIISKTFFRIATRNVGVKKTVYKEKVVSKTKSVKSALFGREVRHLFSSASYILNGVLDIVMLFAMDVFAIIYAPKAREFLAEITAELPVAVDYVPVIVVAVICLMCSITVLGAASISLEGKNIWVLQSLPINTRDILDVKEQFHVVFTAVPGVITCVVLGIVFKVESIYILLMVLLCYLFILLNAQIGVMLNLKKPFLNWTNETVALKQSIPVMISMFGGMILAGVIAGLFFLVQKYLSTTVYLCLWILLLGILSRLCELWIRGKGCKIFETL